MGRSTRNKELKKIAEALPDLWDKRAVGMFKKGFQIYDQHSNEEVREICKLFGVSRLEMDKDYSFKYPVRVKVDHYKKLKYWFNKFGQEGINEYTQQVKEANILIEAERKLTQLNNKPWRRLSRWIGQKIREIWDPRQLG